MAEEYIRGDMDISEHKASFDGFIGVSVYSTLVIVTTLLCVILVFGAHFHWLTAMFVSAIVGGLGSPLGAIAGGFIIAFSEVGITYAWKKVLSYMLPESLEPSGLVQLMSTDYKFAVSFVILIIVLLFRPTGLFKGKSV